MLIELFFQFFIYSIVFLVLLVIDEPQTSLTNSNTKEIFNQNQVVFMVFCFRFRGDTCIEQLLKDRKIACKCGREQRPRTVGFGPKFSYFLGPIRGFQNFAGRRLSGMRFPNGLCP